MRINIANEADVKRISRRDHIDYITHSIDLEVLADNGDDIDAFMSVRRMSVDSRGRRVGLHFGQIRVPVSADGTISVQAARRAIETLIAIGTARKSRSAA